MKHNKHVCAVLYTEEEYETLVLECNWKSKTNVKHSNNRYFYKCIYCSQHFYDKMTFHIICSWIYASLGIGLMFLKYILCGYDRTIPSWTWMRWNLEKMQIHLSSGLWQASRIVEEKNKKKHSERRPTWEEEMHWSYRQCWVVRRSTVRTQVVTTEANGDEILIFGCLEIDPHPCQSGCMIVYRSCNASQIISKLKVKLSRIEVTECAKAEAKTFIIENRFDFAPS